MSLRGAPEPRSQDHPPYAARKAVWPTDPRRRAGRGRRERCIAGRCVRARNSERGRHRRLPARRLSAAPRRGGRRPGGADANRRSRTARRSAVVSLVARVEPFPSGSACTLDGRAIASGPSADARNSHRTPSSDRRALHALSLLRSRVACCNASTSRREAAADAPLRLHLLDPPGAAARPSPISVQVSTNLLPSGGWRMRLLVGTITPILKWRSGLRRGRWCRVSAASVSTAHGETPEGST